MKSLITRLVQIFSATSVKIAAVTLVAIIIGGVTLVAVRATDQHDNPLNNTESETATREIDETAEEIVPEAVVDEADETNETPSHSSTPRPRPTTASPNPTPQAGNAPNPAPATPQYRITVSADKCSVTFYGKTGFQFSLAVSDTTTGQGATRGAGDINYFEPMSADTMTFLTGSTPTSDLYLHARIKDNAGNIVATVNTTAVSTVECAPSNYF